MYNLIGREQQAQDCLTNMSEGEKTYSQYYKEGFKTALDQISSEEMEKMVDILADVKAKAARVFLLGVGGSAGSCSHAVNDFRKICRIEAYTPVDNVSELTARTNDDGWHTVFKNWLEISHLKSDDALMIFSVGGGNLEKNVSPNIVEALKYAQEMRARILGIVGRDGGYTRQVADVSILVPTISSETITPYVESMHGVVWHGLVNNPRLQG